MTKLGHDAMTEIAKATPPAGAFVAWFAGLDLQHWVLAATLIYTLLLIVEKLHTFWKWRKHVKDSSK